MATKKKSKRKPETGIAKPPPWHLFNTVVERLVDIGEVLLAECAAKQQGTPAEDVFNLTINFRAFPVRNKTESEKFGVLVQFTLIAADPTAPSDPATQPFLSIRAVFLAEYTLRSMEGITPEHLSVFAQRNSVFNVWPYWREFVQSTLARMGIPPISIPVYRQGMTSLQGTVQLDREQSPPKSIKSPDPVRMPDLHRQKNRI